MSEEARAAAILVSMRHDPRGGLDDNQHGIPLGSAPQQGMSNVEQQQQQASPPEGVSQDHSDLAMAVGFSAENHNLQGSLYQLTAQAVTTNSQNNPQLPQALGSDAMDIDTAQATATMDNRGTKRSKSPIPEAAESNKPKRQKSYRPVILPCTYDADGRATYPGPKTYVDQVNKLRHGRYTLMEGQLPPTTGLRKPERKPGPRRTAS